MNRKIWGAALVCLMLFWQTALAEIAGINIMGAVPVIDAPAICLQVRALDSAGEGIRTERENFVFTAGAENVELETSTVPDGNRGHIIVVDTSLYYYGSKNIKAEDIQEIVDAYLARLSPDERVMFVLTTDALRPTCTNYMTLSEARQYVQGIELSQNQSARINTAIYEAFNYAISPAQGAPAFHSVFIVADPDLASNNDREHTLEECIQLRAESGLNFDVAVANVYRKSFLEDTSQGRRTALEQGFEQYEDFATRCAGKYMRIPQDNNGVDTDSIYTELASWMYTAHEFLVDFSALSGHIAVEPQEQSVTLSIACGGAVRTLGLTLNTALLPDYVPENSSVTPALTPVVAVGQSDSAAMQVIHALMQMHYLSESSDEFDNECFLAYIDFCQNNGIDPRDGVYEETYALMLSGEAQAASAQTPEPTATPQPTIPPQGYTINDQDAEGSGGFIAAMQGILKSLNCYEDGAASNVGRLDQATIDAVARYCEAFNWRNDHANGVSREICQEILTNGPKLNPLEEEELTVQQRLKAFVAGSTQIMQVAVPNWILIAVCVVLLVGIAVIMILGRPGKPEEEARQTNSAIRGSDGPEDHTLPADDFGDEATVSTYAKKAVQMEIRYEGEVLREEIMLAEGVPFTIGRMDNRGAVSAPNLVLNAADRSVSRGCHAVLLYKNDQIYLSDSSKYHNTTLNGITVFGREGKDGLPVGNGDEIKVSNHVILIKW